MGSEERQQELFSEPEEKVDTSVSPEPQESKVLEDSPVSNATSDEAKSEAREPISQPEIQQIPLSESECYIIDSYALIYQLFFALPPMSGPSGQPIGAIHGMPET